MKVRQLKEALKGLDDDHEVILAIDGLHKCDHVVPCQVDEDMDEARQDCSEAELNAVVLFTED